MLLVMLAALLLIWDGVLSRLDGLLLLAGMTMLVLWTIHLARSARPDDPLEAEFAVVKAAVALILVVGVARLILRPAYQ